MTTTLERIAEIQDTFRAAGVDLDWEQAETVLEYDRAYACAGQPGFAHHLARMCGLTAAKRIMGLRLVLGDDATWRITEATP